MRLVYKLNKHYLLFAIAIIYALMTMLIMRELVIPLAFPSSTGGHIPGDASYYHRIANEMCDTVQMHGISGFVLRINGQGVAGATAALYLIWANPYIVIFINAFLHAISVVMMVLIIQIWFSYRKALIASIPLFISPYMMVYFSQINKESYALAGTLMLTYGLLRFIYPEKTPHDRQCLSLLFVVGGILSIWLVRPYINQILLPYIILILSLAVLSRIKCIYYKKKDVLVFFAYSAIIIVCLAVLGHGSASDKTIASLYNYKKDNLTLSKNINSSKSNNVSNTCFEKISLNSWKKTQLIPEYFDKKLKAIIGQRCNIFTLLETHKNQATLGSIVDYKILPSGSLESLSYLPRAFQLGVFSPWPKTWMSSFKNKRSYFYLITPLESLFLYFGLTSLCVLIWKTKQWTLMIPISMSIYVMSIYGMAIPFFGALYRYRYPWWALLICLGVAAFLDLIKIKDSQVVKVNKPLCNLK